MDLNVSNIKSLFPVLAAILLVAGLGLICALPQPHDPVFESDSWTVETFPVPTSTTELAAMANGPDLPSHLMTPGAVFHEATLAKIQQANYAKSVRDVPLSRKKQVLERYGHSWSERDQFEIDHLVPLCLGGSNSVENLWPQPYAGNWNARVKDRLERDILAKVRHGEIPLQQAQDAFAQDWLGYYQRTFHEAEPRAEFIHDDEQ